MRQISVDGVIYKWLVGRAYVLVRRDEDGASVLCEPCNVIAGVSPDTWDRGVRKRYSAIRPNMVATAIRNRT